MSTTAWLPTLGSNHLALIFLLPYGVAYSFYQRTWFWSGLLLYCISTPVSLPKCSQFPFLSHFYCLFSSPIVCFIWVLPALPLFLSKRCFFQKQPGNEQLPKWIMEDAGSDAMPIHVPKWPGLSAEKKKGKEKKIICIFQRKVFSCSLWWNHEQSECNRTRLGWKMLDETVPD